MTKLKEFPTDYSERLERLRCSLGVSYRKMAENCEKSVQNFYNISKGHVSLTPPIALAICKAYPQVSFNWLMFGEGEMFKDAQNIATASGQHSTAVAGNNNNVSPSDLSSLIAMLSKRDEQIDRLLSIIETFRPNNG